MGLSNLMKQAQEMQEKMQQAQEELTNLEVTGESGGGLVKVTMTGRHDVTDVHLDPSLLTLSNDNAETDKDLLEDLIAAAINDAVRKVESESKGRMAEVTAGLPLPPGFKLPL